MMGFVVALMIIWLIIIQLKLSEVSSTLKDLTKQLLNPNDEQQNPIETHVTDKITEPENISDIPDDLIFNTKDFLPETNSELENCKTVITESEIQTTENITSSKNTFESLFLGNIFNKIGALAILIGVIIFIKIISPFLVFTPQIKTALGFLAGIVMIACAMKIHAKENLKNYAEVLLGTGFGTMFITTYCASEMFHIFSMPVTFSVATGLLLASFYLADKLKTVSMLVVSLIAGYLNPFFIDNSETTGDMFLFGYLMFLNLFSITYSLRHKNRNTINVVNLILTAILLLISTTTSKMNILMPAMLWGIYFVYDLILGIEEENLNTKTLNYTNYIIFTLFSIVMTTPSNNYILFAASQGVIGLFYAAAAYARKDKPFLFNQYLRIFLTTTILAIYAITKENTIYRPYIWSAEGLILIYFAAKYKLTELATWGAGILLSAYVSIFSIKGTVTAASIETFKPIWNIRLAAFAPILLSGFAASRMLCKSENSKLQQVSKILQFEYLSFCYLYAAFEAYDIIGKFITGANISQQFLKSMIYSIMGFIYTIQTKSLHNNSKHIIFAIASVSAFVISLFYLLSCGFVYKPISAFLPVINIRFTAFLTAICASILLAKWMKHEIFKYLAAAFGFILMHVELTDLISKLHLINADYIISIGWILYSGVITAIGIFADKKAVKVSGITLCILSICRIFFYDLASVEILYKFAAFLSLGIMLLLLSYFYNKRQK